MRLSIEAVRGIWFRVRDEAGAALYYAPLGECLDYIERRFIEDEVGRIEVRSAPVDLIRFAKSGQLAPVTESNP